MESSINKSKQDLLQMLLEKVHQVRWYFWNVTFSRSGLYVDEMDADACRTVRRIVHAAVSGVRPVCDYRCIYIW